MKKIFLILSLLYSTTTTFSQEKVAPISSESQMKEYFFVMLKHGPNRTDESVTANILQKGHMANIQKMAGDGHLAIAEPGDDGNWRGISKSIEETKKLVDKDPMIQAGWLTYKIHPWWTMKGAKLD